MSKIQIVQDGSIQGWAVSLLITLVTLVSWVAALLSQTIADRYTQIGSTISTIVVGQFTAWLAYKGATKIAEMKYGVKE